MGPTDIELERQRLENFKKAQQEFKEIQSKEKVKESDQDILPEHLYVEAGMNQSQQIEEQKEALNQFQMEYIQQQMQSTFTP